MQSARLALFGIFRRPSTAVLWVVSVLALLAPDVALGSEFHAFTVKTLLLPPTNTSTNWPEVMAGISKATTIQDQDYCDVMTLQLDDELDDRLEMERTVSGSGAYLHHISAEYAIGCIGASAAYERQDCHDWLTVTRDGIYGLDSGFLDIYNGRDRLMVTEVSIFRTVPGVRVAVINTRLSDFNCDDILHFRRKLDVLREYIWYIRERATPDVIIIAGYFGVGYDVPDCPYYPWVLSAFEEMKRHMTYAGEQFEKGNITDRSTIYYWTRAEKVEVKVADFKKSSDDQGDSAIATFHMRNIQESDPE